MARLANSTSLDSDLYLSPAGKNFRVAANSCAAKAFLSDNVEAAALAEVGNAAKGLPIVIKAAYIEAIFYAAKDAGLDVKFN